ncbi:MAG: Smr/MutS family protein [Deltaproteobacteria bacterium]|nr:Smr/MutS family protein [Deltaproteobacteria bacterium]
MRRKALEDIEYGRVLEWLADVAHSEPGMEAALALAPGLPPERILAGWALIAEARAGLAVSDRPDLREHLDLADILGVLGPEGARLDMEELKAVASEARAAACARGWLAGRAATSPGLAEIYGETADFSELSRAFETTLGPEGEILDTASPRLARLRQEIGGARAALTLRLGELIRSEEYKPLLMDDLVTTRNDRFVIPVRASATGKNRGLVHDWSNTGSTAYLEPLETVEDNNRLALLKREEKREIDRILARLAAMCRERVPDLRRTGEALTRLDLVIAEAELATLWRARPPDYLPGGGYKLVMARHPLLERRLNAEGRRMVPLDITLEPARPLAVVSGVNTGGKTVALKTLGLAAALASAGLLPPVGEGSSLDFPADLITVMGDGQDLSADLSTFSGHVAALGEALELARPGALILVDELGSGTDPGEGAALGLAALERLSRSGALVLAATHFHLIKSWAALTEGVESVSVNTRDSGRPAYGLSYGTPGYSGGLDTARRLGLPADVVDRAESLLDDGQRKSMELLRRLDETRGELEREREACFLARKELEATEKKTSEAAARQAAEYNKKASQLDAQVRSALAKNRREQEDLKREVRRALAEQKKVDPVAAALAWAKMDDELREARPERVPETPAEPAPEAGPGDLVLVSSLGRQGRVVSVSERGECSVDLGGLTVRVGRSELFQPRPGKKDDPPSGRVTFNVSPRERVLEINLIGRTVEEAEAVVDREIDRALVNRQERLTIIHGLGTGRLRHGVVSHLRRHPAVKGFSSPGIPGGAGVTEVELIVD